MLDAEHPHPIMTFAVGLVRMAPGGTCTIEERAGTRLTQMLVEHRNDPLLPGVVLFLFGLATTLFEQPGSDGAAYVILKALGEARPQLPALAETNGILGDRLEVAQKRAGDLVARAPGVDQPAPVGSLKAAAFLNPGRQTPR